MEKNKTIQSANFKKDYITAFAVGLFFLMVFCEFFVAISIPLTINYTALYAEHGVRQKLIADFDKLRKDCNKKIKNADPVTVMEKKLIRWDLDIISSHLREYSRTMPIKEVENIASDLAQYNNIVTELNQVGAKPFCQTQTLDMSKITKRIENHLNSKYKNSNIKK